MNFNDLKVLVDCACADYSNDGIIIAPGYKAAMQRLIRRRLIEENPHRPGSVRITRRGELLVERLLEAAK